MIYYAIGQMVKSNEPIMCRVFHVEILESPEELEERVRVEKDVRKRERLQFLYWYKTGQAITRKALGKLLHRSQFASALYNRPKQFPVFLESRE